MRTRLPLLLLAVVTACSSASTGAAPSSRPSSPPASTHAPSLATTTSAAGTVWICPPDRTAAPCTADLDTTVIGPSGAPTRSAVVPAVNPPADCFYVYPTVSQAPGDNAPRTSAPEVVDAIHAQAAPFSTTCHVVVPAYRQVTLRALLSGRYSDPKAQATAYADVRAAWHDYLAHARPGRRFVLLGHSQGAFLLTRLIHDEIDRTPAVRARLLSAILLGANVTVPAGKDVGGDFTQIPACRRGGQTGCVIAWSTFDAPPVANALFARTGIPGRQVLCTDPTALGGQPGLLQPWVPANRVSASLQPLPGTGFATYPDGLRGACRTASGATWLQVAPVAGARLPAFQDALGPTWGLHIADVTVAVGNLVEAVRRQEAAPAKG